MEMQHEIHAFWFGSNPDDAAVAAERAKLWWAKDAAVDAEMRRRFASCVAGAASGRLDAWLATPRGRLTLILVTDQFPRNIYRDTAQAFCYDALALAWSKDGIRDGVHLSLRPIERVFFYLPLEHSEALDDQVQSLQLFSELVANAKPEHKAMFDDFLRFAQRHHEIIACFGRFPHRNRILGRASTPEEQAFLQQKGSSF
jgi:uncharacterized protein (DUF924 family)